MREQGNNNRKMRSKRDINTGEMLVPDVSRDLQNKADSGEQAFWEGKL